MLRNRSRLRAALSFFILALAAVQGQSAPIPYQVQPLVGPNSPVVSSYLGGDTRRAALRIEGLSDNGQLLFTLAGGGFGQFLYDHDHFTVVPPPAGTAPGGFWPRGVAAGGSINQQGEVAFTAEGEMSQWLGVFVWNPQTQQYTTLALPGLRPVATRSLVFGGSDPYAGPLILNNQDEVAFTAPLSDLAGNSVAAGLFFRDRDGQMMPVAISGDTLPGLGTIHYVQVTSLNDSGVVAFLASVNSLDWSAFTWDKGKITPVALLGQALPGGEAIFGVFGAWVNDVNHNLLLDVLPKGTPLGNDSLYLAKDGQFTRLVEPTQTMPGGGVYIGSPQLPYGRVLTVSTPNAAGQSVFVAGIEEGSQGLLAAYRIDADGQLTRLLEDGDTVAGGETIAIRYASLYSNISLVGAALNGKGQLALPLAVGAASDVLRYEAFGMITLLTPTGP